jgi:hypothetical protein
LAELAGEARAGDCPRPTFANWVSSRASLDRNKGTPALICRAAQVRRGRVQAFYDRGGSCWSAHVLPSGSLKVTNEPHG